MASEIRVNKINSQTGVGTITLSPTGVDISGITTVSTLKVGTGLTASEDGDIFFTGVCTATTFAGSGANLTSLPAGNLTGALPAISGANLTGIAATDNVRTGILDVAGVSTFRNTMNVGAAVTISESGIEASGIGITVANINGGQIGGRRNMIINGAMMVAQRSTSVTASTGYTTVDRYQQSASNLDNSCDIAQEGLTSGNAYDNGFRKSYKVTNGDNNADTNDQSKINYKIEAQDLANSGWSHKDPKSFVTLSFWVKSSVAQTFPIAIYAEDANMAYGFEYSATTSWTRITHSIPGHASLGINNDNGQGFNIQWYLYMGTDTTSSSFTNADWHTYSSSSRSKDMTTTWQTTNDATFEITGVQLEVGAQATPFEHRSFGEELTLCQRYYYKHAYGSSAGGNLGISNNNMAVGMCAMYTGTAGFGFIPHPVTMRALPTLENATGTDYYRVYANGGADQFNDVATQQFGANGSVINYYDGFSRTQGHAGWIQCYNANAYIAFKAEL